MNTTKKSAAQLLEHYRQIRGFNVEVHISNKISAINEFFRNEGLDSAIIGISGGIDSAVVLALLICASERPNSPIKSIVPMILPMLETEGTTNQYKAERLGELVCNDLGVQGVFIDLGAAHKEIVSNFEETGNSWAKGQLVSALRIPVFYYQAAILQSQGHASIIVGTTNFSESFLGFYGKYSDGMVDLQPIDDIYKNEVVAVARYFNLPEEIINRAPAGDVWNGATDSELIGASYDEVELFIEAKKDIYLVGDLDNLYNELQKPFASIGKMLATNHHKEEVGLPSRDIPVDCRAKS